MRILRCSRNQECNTNSYAVRPWRFDVSLPMFSFQPQSSISDPIDEIFRPAGFAPPFVVREAASRPPVGVDRLHRLGLVMGDLIDPAGGGSSTGADPLLEQARDELVQLHIQLTPFVECALELG